MDLLNAYLIPRTDNPSNTNLGIKAQDSTAARRMYDPRIHVLRSRKVPSGEKRDIRTTKKAKSEF